MPKIISEDVISKIIDDYNIGVSGKDISKKYHVDFVKLKKKLVANNKIIPRETELTYEQLLEISNRYRNGEQLKNLAKEYNIGITKLTTRLKSNSLYFKKYTFIDDDELNTYVKEYNNGYGLTPKEISIKYSRGDSSIINALRKAGVYIEQTSRWTDEEIEILKKYYPLEHVDDIIKRLPRHANKQLIFAKASSLNLPAYNTWLDEEIMILKDKYSKVNIEELYNDFNCRHSKDSIRTKAQRLNLSSNPFWSEKEIEIVRNNYSIQSMDDLLLLLPNKTENAIRGMAKKLSIKSKNYIKEKYTEQQKQFIIDNWKTLNDTNIAKILDKSPAGIKAQREKLGLYKTNRDYSKYESISKFFRGHISEWKNKSMKSCNYQCILTGSKDFAIHHLYGFNYIVKEVFEILDDKHFLKSENIEDYTKDELDYMLLIFKTIHEKYPIGVCVRKDLHNLFHNIYGSGGNTEEQWNTFYNDFNNGLYDEQIA